jgi:hypothetical protein
MVSVHVELALDHALVECGGPVTGAVSWTGNRGLDQVRVMLRYRTEGRGDIDSAVVDHRDLGTAESGQARFRLSAPSLGRLPTTASCCDCSGRSRWPLW